jgi:hypothetical protein
MYNLGNPVFLIQVPVNKHFYFLSFAFHLQTAMNEALNHVKLFVHKI